MNSKRINKRTNITVYKDARRIASYHYKQGHAGNLLAGLQAFYAEVYPSYTMTYHIDGGAL